jgi:hypothetical protein
MATFPVLASPIFWNELLRLSNASETRIALWAYFNFLTVLESYQIERNNLAKRAWLSRPAGIALPAVVVFGSGSSAHVFGRHFSVAAIPRSEPEPKSFSKPQTGLCLVGRRSSGAVRVSADASQLGSTDVQNRQKN